MPEARRWVTDTSVYTHLCRAGHSAILRDLAPGGVILVPTDVDFELQAGRVRYAGIPRLRDSPWAELIVLTEDEEFTQLLVKAAMGGDEREHLGECAVIACAFHRNLTALLDDRHAIAQADLRNVPHHDTLWLVIEAYLTLFEEDRVRAARVVDDLLATGMFLPVDSGDSLFAYAYEEGLLPR